jgi:hypothetical protein
MGSPFFGMLLEPDPARTFEEGHATHRDAKDQVQPEEELPLLQISQKVHEQAFIKIAVAMKVRKIAKGTHDPLSDSRRVNCRRSGILGLLLHLLRFPRRHILAEDFLLSHCDPDGRAICPPRRRQR